VIFKLPFARFADFNPVGKADGDEPIVLAGQSLLSDLTGLGVVLHGCRGRDRRSFLGSFTKVLIELVFVKLVNLKYG
jgi:hypothetical protein